MTGCCLKTETELKKWLKDFQSIACESQTSSASFVKMLSAVTISTILYNREIFPKRLFTVETNKGQKIAILKSKSNCKEANLFYSWITGFQDALEKQYLRSIVLGFYGDASKPETLIENYILTFMYKKENILMSNTHLSNIRDGTMSLLNCTGKAISEFDKLPDKYEMTMKLFYYDEDTPSDYEPPGFKARPDGYALQEAVHRESLFKQLVGSVLTPCHKMKLVTMTPLRKTCPDDESDTEIHEDLPTVLEKFHNTAHSASPSESDTEIHMDFPTVLGKFRDTAHSASPSESDTEIHMDFPTVLGKFRDTAHSASPSYDDPVLPNTSQQSIKDLFDGNDLFNLQNVNADNLTSSAQGDKITENRFKKLSLNKLLDGDVSVFHQGGYVKLYCPCGKKFLENTIQCLSCKTFQHSICFGLLDNKERIAHYCDQCALKYPEISCTNPDLCGLDPISKKELCLFRNALVICSSTRLMSLDNLIKKLQVSTRTAVDIMKEMEKSNLFHSTSIDPTDLTQPRLINQAILSSSVLPHYFLNYPTTQKKSNSSTPELILNIDNDIDDFSEGTPNILSQKQMENKDGSYDGSKRRSSERMKKPVKRYINESDTATRPKIRRKSSTIDSIKHQSDE